MANQVEFKTDARSVKTRKAIKFALMQLLKTKNINDVTVKELTALSDRNRNSFYTHYDSVYDVLRDIDNEVLEYLNVILRKWTFKEFLEKPDDLLNELGKFISSHKKVATLYMTSTSSTQIINATKERLTSQIIRCSRHQFGNDCELTHYVISFFVTGVIDMYHNWLVYGGITIEQLNDVIIKFVRNGLPAVKSELGLI